MKCPICPAEDIPEDSGECPVCKADLTSLQRARQLHVAEYNEAVRLAETGAVDAALRHASAAVALCEEFVPGLILSGKLLRQKGARREAMAAWEEAARLAPDNDEIKGLLSACRVAARRRRMRIVLGWCAAGTVLGLLAGMPWYLALRSFRAQEDVIRQTLEQGREQSVAALLRAVDTETESVPRGPPDVPEAEPGFVRELQMLRDEVREMRVQEVEPDFDDTRIIEDMATLYRELQTAADSIGELLVLVETAAAQQRRLHDHMGAVVQLLKPDDMHLMEDKITQTEKEIAALTREKSSLAGRRDVAAAVRREMLRRRLRDNRARLGELTARWRGRVEPWLRVEEDFCDDCDASETTEADGGRSAAAGKP